MQVLEDMLLTLQELFMLPSVRLRPMLSIPPMEWVILDMLDTLVMVLLILDMPLILFIMLLHMLPLFIMLLDMESPMLLTLLVFMALLLLLSQLFMEPMLVLEDTSPTLLELFMLPSVKQRLILMLTTMHMDTDVVMDSTDKQKNNSLTPDE